MAWTRRGPPTPELLFVTFDCKANTWRAYAESERGGALSRADGDEHDNDDCVGQDDARA